MLNRRRFDSRAASEAGYVVPAEEEEEDAVAAEEAVVVVVVLVPAEEEVALAVPAEEEAALTEPAEEETALTIPAEEEAALMVPVKEEAVLGLENMFELVAAAVEEEGAVAAWVVVVEGWLGHPNPRRAACRYVSWSAWFWGTFVCQACFNLVKKTL